MANCIYCGQPSGLLRRSHSQCADRHDRAVSEIPRFFLQVVDSAIAPARFSGLLQAAAENSYVKPNELRALCAAGINASVRQILKTRPLTAAELQRVSDLTDALGTLFPEGLDVDETLNKAGIINDLYDGNMPSGVAIVGPTPIEFDRGETILWVFNNTRACRMPFAKGNGALLIDPVEDGEKLYFSPDNLQECHIPDKDLDSGVVGDLVLTNLNIYFLQPERGRLVIPVERIESVNAYAEGVHVDCKPEKRRTRLFLIDDAWFAANVLLRLLQGPRQSAQVARG